MWVKHNYDVRYGIGPKLKSQSREITHTSEDIVPIINVIIFQMNFIFAFFIDLISILC